jgi:NitT/TauT family transport system substrate-binding protein
MLERRRFLKNATLGAAAIAGFPAIIASAPAADPVVVATPFGFLPDFIEVMNAASGGHFANAGIAARIVGANGAAQTTQQIVAGQAQFARNAGIDVIAAVGKQGLPLVSIATLYQGATFHLVSLKDKAILDGKDLKGKTVGIVSVGGSTDIFLDLVVAKVGLAKDDVKREVVGNSPGAIQFIRQGRIDCFICSINVVVTLERLGEPIASWSMDTYAPMPGQVYMATRDTVAARPDLVLRFVRAMKASVDEIMSQPLAAIFERAAKDYDIPGLKDVAAAVAVEQASIERLWLSQGKENLMRNVPALWQSGVDALHGIGLVAMTDAGPLFTNKFIDEAARS